MGRHAATPAARRPAPLTPQVLIALAVAAMVLLAGGITWWAVGAGSGNCDGTAVVRVAVAPELAPVAEQVLTDAEGLRPEDCASAQVTAQEPVQTVGDLGALDAGDLPHLWVPDSSLWPARAGHAALETAGSVATSPVVLATSRAAVDALGWTAEAPGWGAALVSEQGIAVPDLATSAEALAALGAVRTSLGGGEDADNAVVQAVLAAERGPSVSPADALAAGGEGAADAPLVPVSEQEVWAANADAEDPQLVAVYPEEGSPGLDYPLVRVGTASATDAAVVDAAVRALTSDAARSAVTEAGFRDADGTAPPGAEAAGIREAAPRSLQLDPAEVQGLLAQLSELAAPSRILTVFDISTSMEAPAGDGTRATLARDAAKSTLTLVPGNFALGLWFFAAELDGERDWTEVVPTRQLEAEVEGTVQRDLLDEELDTIPDRLSPGGTGLYDTTLDAVRAARSDFDPRAVNSVLVVTDGTNEDSGGVDLDELLATLRSEADPDRPIKVIGVALGPDADLGALERIADVTGGAAYSAVDPTDLQTVLFDALRQR
ncbi:substrate-binding domain-containing protein [Geodermatophilus obscurus]|uniref:von Willebrand factor type A n=1 Tax=Geodermatophilus obscurus (strain ATCC 25078 / DSM 43160 / JCM 3152 / CCUG 61914 / KCC A-0152 / KCTC 9177 / NBRC 13315 / NRRL B-3577 / G-20) TaxID=526225 RepID=D2S628_GEOOG|nr:substrate-binding domain-containing protein [Geodermatophilus obscurus]ADB73245.1 von Willebrand factor type A [Geodermatophilus obscurus DSM 43160]